MAVKAVNEFVFIKRDETKTEQAGIILPPGSREKPHSGTIVSVGASVKDGNIKNGKGKKCLFHKTVGFSIEWEGEEYLVLLGNEIIGIV